ncbi:MULTISPECIES: ABC transporter substrate-binding protein [Streptomycetaceae]|uniref:ABC transporter, substrate binding protein n=1 Tax=Streptantibioticus cattleyicolor (strain ATCC 35852 / DSM 46488 / JCM 4925 / NBRC 14057 / NRRL 8057) TaxID=1003195 RepID=F8JRN5_STREN|nr:MULTISPECIES: ABC transporter substrate-binding protein [Streptomycetaceae]AEW97923.1 ABC transporter, substrate binding protein [Streptantibioticus cattleyicolor NRRL 8057 = DSM 46488]MYS62328.1 ABC transporter substrate-binding protein [Streptomyces sp. SID5468]CCB78239.1 ABC transporter, substrate binding protein [Streptantibioticus cattleyicolor NRRL 8057 = DSM 46488]
MGPARDGALVMGVVVARSGRLAGLGDPPAFAMSSLEPWLDRVRAGTATYPVRLVSRDSRSTAEGGRRAVRELAGQKGARIVVTLAGTQVLPAVADGCEEAGVPCVSSAFPWQAYYYGRGATEATPFRWTYHFCWGLDAIAETFTDLWALSGAGPTVGCLWNDGPQGTWSREAERGFAAVARARGYRLVDPAAYQEPAADLGGHADAFAAAGAELVTSAATARDLALFRTTAAERGTHPRLITCSRRLAYPPSVTGGERPAQADVATLAYWTPRHPYRSSLDGTTAARLAEEYERHTGCQWLQPLGLAHALIEVAVHALRTAADPTDRAAVADAIARTKLETVAGPLDWTAGPVPNVATVRLAGGQWRPGRHHDDELSLVTDGGIDGLRAEADLVLSR